ncbi:MAG: protease HtpX [Porticoccaceae bacterium]|jgi:heat shock protein HtpX|nr:protease HtpX [Porticoccaceae bacterium]
MLRIALFLATNIAVLVLVSLIFQVLGLEQYLAGQGVHTNLTALLVFCGLFGFLGSFISLLLSKPMAKLSTRTQIIAQPADDAQRWLLATVRELARKADIGMPEVGVFPARQANAFATGWNKNNALVAVSSGLLERFDRDEARAVLAHEIGHVANGDMVTLSLVQGVLNTFVLFLARVLGSVIDRVIFKNERGHGIGYFFIVIALQVVLGILASMVVMAFSRWREFRADAAGARLASRGAMIAALEKLRRETEAHLPSELPDSLTAFGISGGWKQRAAKLFMTHPPLGERIEALRRGG